jgi:hypothetical protein
MLGASVKKTKPAVHDITQRTAFLFALTDNLNFHPCLRAGRGTNDLSGGVAAGHQRPSIAPR